MKQTTKDNLIYLGVGLAIAAALTFYIFYTDRTMGRIPEIPRSILWGILSTPGIVALLFEHYWQFRRHWSLWLVSITAASINASTVFIAYYLRWDPPVLVWSTMTGLLVFIVFIVAGRILFSEKRR